MIDADVPNSLGNTQPVPHLHVQGSWRIAVLFGFLGGVIPTCLKLASAFAGQQQDIDMPRFTFWVAVGFYGLVGATVAVAFKQYVSREAFIAGIVAPSLVTNLISGYGEGVARRPVKTTESLIWEYMSPIGRAHAADVTTSQDAVVSIGVGEKEATKKLDLEWDVPKDITIAKVKFRLIPSQNGAAEKTVYVSPNFSGALEVPATYNYISVENGAPLPLPDGVSHLKIHGDVRTSKTNDFWWGLGAPRFYKILNAKAEVSSNGVSTR